MMCTNLGNILWWGTSIIILWKFINIKTPLNKNYDIVENSQIPVMWQCISIPLAKQVHLCKMNACLPLLFASFKEQGWWHNNQSSHLNAYISSLQARSQGGGGVVGGGRPPPPPQKNAKKCTKKKGEREKKREENNHFQSKITYKFVLYEENTGHMHQIAPLTTSKCKKLSLCRSLRSLGLGRFAPSHVILPPP